MGVETRAARLRAFIENTGKGPITWGVDDCSAAPVAWLNQECGLDIRRPVYNDRDGAHRIIGSYGELAETWSALATENGISERYDDPELGDIAVIDTRLYGQIGGICADNGVLLIRVERAETQESGWRALGPIRKFLKVFRAP